MNRKEFFKVLIAIPVVAVAKRFLPEEIPYIENEGRPIPIKWGPFDVDSVMGEISPDSLDYLSYGWNCRHEWNPNNIESGVALKIKKSKL